jgi:N-acetylglucosaminylphosphatidylinositol deacetylase
MILALVLLPLGFYAAIQWLSLLYLHYARDDRERLQRGAVLVIAHPDDETMFFLPFCKTINLKRLLCLSDGNFDGIGIVRRKELQSAAQGYGCPDLVIGEFSDGPRETWTPVDVAEFLKHQGIDETSVIVSFDQYGVSGHANHIACYRGVVELKRSFPSLQTWALRSDTYTLPKYMGPFGAVLALVFRSPRQIALINADPFDAYKRMAIHGSQFVWYRRLFIVFARCIYINILETPS